MVGSPGPSASFKEEPVTVAAVSGSYFAVKCIVVKDHISILNLLFSIASKVSFSNNKPSSSASLGIIN